MLEVWAGQGLGSKEVGMLARVKPVVVDHTHYRSTPCCAVKLG